MEQQYQSMQRAVQTIWFIDEVQLLHIQIILQVTKLALFWADVGANMAHALSEARMTRPIQSVAIIGGGTAGWMAAAALAGQLPRSIRLTLVESDAIGTIGVGEATIPAIRKFNQVLGIDEADFLKATNGTFKIGIEFVDWGKPGQTYMHSFSPLGGRPELRPTHQYWLRMKALGAEVPDLDDCSIGGAAARTNRFRHPRDARSDPRAPELSYAYHFDASLYARYLRAMAEKAGVTRVEGRISSVDRHPENGDIAGVRLDDGRTVAADLFVDCSGMRALLIGGALAEPYEDWSEHLICDRAVAMPCAAGPTLYNHTRAKACAAGWQWRIPLQHRFGNGYVYSSRHIGDDEAAAALRGSLEGAELDAPRLIAFTPGKRRRVWVRNCIALGLSAGFIEPLESTSIHLIHMGIRRLISLFPARGVTEPLIKAYNRQTDFEHEDIRDFIIAHYKVTGREDTPFWRYVKSMSVPDSLKARLELFASGGLYFRAGEECFTEASWVQVLIGQGLEIEGHDLLADAPSPQWTAGYLKALAGYHRDACARMPDHVDFIAGYCRAGAAA
jgi:tryptophan halogenase